MIFQFLRPFLYGAIGICLYAFLIRRLSDFVHPTRLALAAVGEQTLAMDLTKDERSAVTFMLDNAFSPLSAVLICALPFILVPLSLVSKKRSDDASPAFKANRAKISGLFLISAFGANPFFAFIAVNEAILVGVLLLLLGRSRHILRDWVLLMRAETATLTAVSNMTWHSRSV